MNERYSKLYSLPQNLYADEMPVVISAGSLLKDNMTGKVLAQLKIKNIGDRAIKALTVRLHMFDIASKPLGGSFEYQYLDLDVQRDMEFGTQTPISLPDHTARSYSVSVVHIIFSDNEEWVNQNENCDWKQLPKYVDLIQGLGSAALAKEYEIKFGEACKQIPVQQDDLWICACGHINHQSEEICHYCHNALADFLDPELVAELRAHNEECEHRARERKQHRKKLIQKISCVLIALIIVIPTIVLIDNNLPYAKYKKALVWMDKGYYGMAYSMLSEIKDHRLFSEDIKEMLEAHISQLISENNYASVYDHITLIKENGLTIEGVEETMWDWIYEEFFLDVINDSTIWDNYSKRHYAAKLLSYLPESSYPGAKELKELFDLSFREWFNNNREFAQQKWNEMSILRDRVEQDYVITYFLEGEWSTEDGKYYFNMSENHFTRNNLPATTKPSGGKYYDIEDLIYYWDDDSSNHLARVFKFTIVDCNTIKIYSYKDYNTYTLYRK